jgi:predicted DNA-binding protein YlxM (UPF0122 family)
LNYSVRKIEAACKLFEMPIEFGLNGRKRFLQDRLNLKKDSFREMTTFLIDANEETKEFVFDSLKKTNREITYIEKELKRLNNYQPLTDIKSNITPDMIERAREYPISNLIEVKRNKALCPFHNDHNPSLGIKNNRYHCFACGEKGDPIDFVIKRDGVSFQEAVKWLSNQ